MTLLSPEYVIVPARDNNNILNTNETTSSSDIQSDDGDGVDFKVMDHFISDVFGDKVYTPYPPTIGGSPDNVRSHANNVAISTWIHKQLIIKMITIFDNISEWRKKSLKHHSGAMLRTVLRYARVSKVALLLTVELVVKIAADIFCLIHTNRQTDSNTGIKRHPQSEDACRIGVLCGEERERSIAM